MAIDYRKFFESPRGLSKAAGADAGQTAHAPDVGADAAAAAVFPLNWFARLLQYGMMASLFGYVAHIAFTGNPERDLWKILFGCLAVLCMTVFLPYSIALDSRGIHQRYLLGLYEYSIPRQAILSYRETTRAELRREGKLWFSRYYSSRLNRDGEYEPVVIVNGRYGGRYILHGFMHSGRYRFIEELEKRGIPAHGYEGWGRFMADRGFPTDAGAL